MTKRNVVNGVLFCGAIILALSLMIAPAKSQANGEAVYKAKCATCHGADGVGATAAGKATKARDFCSDEVKKETDDEWTTIIVKGKNKMPSYDKKLTDAEVKDLVAYIRGLCKK
ncbi:MAG TPA: cytochrome c [Candidatus Angelobacter sp.]|nr:cytochrome c [Candidatus Angelobacter sp.]